MNESQIAFLRAHCEEYFATIDILATRESRSKFERAHMIHAAVMDTAKQFATDAEVDGIEKSVFDGHYKGSGLV